MEKCIVCNKPATTKYGDAESCGNIECELKIQEAIDAVADAGHK